MKACGMFYDAIVEGTLKVRPTNRLDLAVEGAVKKDLGDGGFAWHRDKSSKPVEPLLALSMAYFGARTKSPEPFIL